MASTQLATTTLAHTLTHQRAIVRIPSTGRKYVVYCDGTNLVYEYTDDDDNWSSPVTIAAGARLAHVFPDVTRGRLHIVYAGGNATNVGLAMRAITSNLASGVPGALTTETVIDAGGTNLGVIRPYAFLSDTGTNPRYWIIATKLTAASTYETRVWYCAAGSAADTAGNWVTTNFTNLGGNSDGNANKGGVGVHWTVGGADKVTLVFCEGSDDVALERVTFDPTAATPTPGTVGTVTGSSAHLPGDFGEGPAIAIAAKADYLVVGCLERTSGTWDFFKTVNGTTWTQPTGWDGLTMGRCQIAYNGTDFFLVHTESYGALATTAQPLKYRKLTVASDNMGGAIAFSDQNGNGVSVPELSGATTLPAFYRGSTASPYTLRFDTVSITVGGGDVTPPGQASVAVGVVTGTTIPLALVMPPDVDVAQVEVRYLTGATPPASDRSNGTVSLAPTDTSADASVPHTITGLTAGTQISGRVFVKDASGNWNTGASFTAVPVTKPTFVGRFRADGVNPIADGLTPGTDLLVWQLAASNFLTGGANAHAELRVGTDAAAPPTENIFDILSTGGTSVWQYENSAGVWTNWPSSGLPSSEWGRRIRVNVDTDQVSQFGSMRVKQG